MGAEGAREEVTCLTRAETYFSWKSYRVSKAREGEAEENESEKVTEEEFGAAARYGVTELAEVARECEAR